MSTPVITIDEDLRETIIRNVRLALNSGAETGISRGRRRAQQETTRTTASWASTNGSPGLFAHANLLHVRG
jgi:hypothetical protein